MSRSNSGASIVTIKLDQGFGHGRVGQRVLNDVVKTTEQRLIEHPDEVGRGHHAAVRVVALQELKK